MEKPSPAQERIISDMTARARPALRDFHEYWYLGSRFQYKEFLGYVHTPFRSQTLNFNSMGFRGGEFERRRRPGVRRIGFFGSSALLGAPNVADDETIPVFCVDELARAGFEADAINFSVMCSLIKDQYAVLLWALLEFELDALVVYVGYNDVLRAYHGNIWKGYEDVETILKRGFEWNTNRSAPSYHLRNAWEAMKRRAAFALQPRGPDAFERALQLRREAARRKTALPSSYDDGRRLFLTIVAQICSLAQQRGLPVIFSHQPALSATAKATSDYEQAYERNRDLTFGSDAERAERDRATFRENYELQRAQAHELAASLGATVYDPEVDVARSRRDEDVFFDFAHLTALGNRIVARGLAGALLKAGCLAREPALADRV